MQGPGMAVPARGGPQKKSPARPERLCKRGSLLFIEGEAGNEMFVVRSGKIRLLRHEGERTAVIDTVTPGNVIGEMSLLRGEPRDATAQVVEDSVVVPVDEDYYAATMKNIPAWLGGALRSLVRRLVDTLAHSREETIRKGIAGVIRVLLLSVDGSGRRGPPDNGMPLGELKELLFHLTGLRDAEIENVFMHLILKRMIGISRDDRGSEMVRIANREVLELYLVFLRARRENQPFPYETIPLAAFDIAGFILTAEELTGTADRNRCISVTHAALEEVWGRKGKKLPFDRSALAAIAEAPAAAGNGPFVFNLERLRRLHCAGTWLPIFKEDVKL